MPTRSQTKRTLPSKKGHPPKATNSSGKRTAPQTNPPAGNNNPATGKKRKGTDNKNPPNLKRAKTTSAAEVRPLTMADILDIVAAVADANRREKPVQVRISRRTPRSGSSASQALTSGHRQS